MWIAHPHSPWKHIKSITLPLSQHYIIWQYHISLVIFPLIIYKLTSIHGNHKDQYTFIQHFPYILNNYLRYSIGISCGIIPY